jgi:hypothetical protein
LYKESNLSNIEIAQRYKIGVSEVTNIVKGKKWCEIGIRQICKIAELQSVVTDFFLAHGNNGDREIRVEISLL